MQQKVLHFDCRSKIRGSIPPYLLSLCQRSKCQRQIFVWFFFFYFFLILISSMVEQDTSNIQIQVRVLDRNIYSYIQIKNNKLIQKKSYLDYTYSKASVFAARSERFALKLFFSSIYQSRKVPNTLEKKNIYSDTYSITVLSLYLCVITHKIQSRILLSKDLSFEIVY